VTLRSEVHVVGGTVRRYDLKCMWQEGLCDAAI
jgi:hypothetical protein